MKRNYHGFTLVELIVCITILAILALAVMGILTAASGSFDSIYSGVNVRTVTQTALNQLENYIIDCNGTICYNAGNTPGSPKTLTLTGRDSGGSETTTVFSYIPTECVLKLNGDRMAGKVTAFTVTLHKNEITDPETGDITETLVPSADITLTVGFEGHSHTETRSVALRNRVALEGQ